MATQLQDARIRLTLEVGGAERGAKGLREKRKREDREEERERKKKQKDVREKIRKGADLRGIGTDVLRGRVPGLGRFGSSAAKIAAYLGMLYAATELGPQVLGAAEGGTGGLAKPFTYVPKKILEGLDRLLPYIEAFLTASDVTRDDIVGQIVAGKKPTAESEADFFGKQYRLAQLNATAEHAKRRLGKEIIGKFFGEYLKDKVVEVFRAIFGSPEAKKELDRIIDERIDRKLEQGGLKGANPAGAAGRSYR